MKIRLDFKHLSPSEVLGRGLEGGPSALIYMVIASILRFSGTLEMELILICYLHWLSHQGYHLHGAIHGFRAAMLDLALPLRNIATLSSTMAVMESWLSVTGFGGWAVGAAAGHLSYASTSV